MQHNLVNSGEEPALLASLFGPHNGPKGPLEEYLLTDLDKLVDHQRVLSFVVYRYKMALSECNRNIRELSAHIEQLKVEALHYWREQKQPGTEKPYSFDEAKEMRKSDPSVRQNEYYLSCWLSQRDELDAYLKALTVKVSLSPGLQGTFNRLFEDQ